VAHRMPPPMRLMPSAITTGAEVRVSVGYTGVLTCQSAIAANDVVGIADTSLGLDA